MRNRKLTTACEVTLLEDRVLNCVEEHDALGFEYAVEPAIVAPATTANNKPAAAAGTKHALSELPALHSNPGTTAKLYLDFVGAAATNWGGRSVPATPAYDQDGDAATFTDSELANINQIFARVAEKYAPFNLDVTTADPGQYLDRKAQRVVIGGNGAWFGSAGGVSYVGAFSNSASNTSWVFSKNLGSGNAKFTAEAAAHEAGHAFGLDHQSAYNAAGQKTDEYNPGDSKRAPIMGNSYDAARGLWWKGTPSSSSTDRQDDMAVIAGSDNGFGYRSDDHANTLDAATPVVVSGTGISASGIITSTSDTDVFSFTTGGGQVALNGSVIATGPTLDLKLQLYNAAGTLVSSADTAGLGEAITMNLAAGSYKLIIASHGGYGDVGRYTISGAITPAGTISVGVPTGLSATAAGNVVTLGWKDNAGNEDAYVVERSTDGTTWSTLATLGANVVKYTDSTGLAGQTYKYRMFARGGSIRSDYSNVASVSLVANPPVQPPTNVLGAPTGLVVVRKNWTQVTIRWTDNSAGETGFRIEYSADGVNWNVLGRTRANSTAADAYGFRQDRNWSFRIKATATSGDSAYGNTATLTANTASSSPAKSKAPRKNAAVFHLSPRKAA